MGKCRDCLKHLNCDWKKPPKNCKDFRRQPPEKGTVTGSLGDAFRLLKGKRCRIRLRGGRRFIGVPVAMEPGDFMLVKGEGSILVVNEGHEAELTPLE